MIADQRRSGKALPLAFSIASTLRQVFPGWIEGNNEGDFLDSQLALDALLALDCVMKVFEAPEIHEPVELVLRGESRAASHFAFADPPHQIVGDADVQVFERFVIM